MMQYCPAVLVVLFAFHITTEVKAQQTPHFFGILRTDGIVVPHAAWKVDQWEGISNSRRDMASLSRQSPQWYLHGDSTEIVRTWTQVDFEDDMNSGLGFISDYAPHSFGDRHVGIYGALYTWVPTKVVDFVFLKVEDRDVARDTCKCCG